MSKKLPKKDDNGIHDGINMTSGNSDDFITSFSVAIGMLLTGTDVKDSKGLGGKVTTDGKPDPRKKGILGLLSKMTDSIDTIIGGSSKDVFKKYWSNAAANQAYLKENVLNENGIIKHIEKIPILLESIDKNIAAAISGSSNKNAENLNIEIKGAGDFSKMLESLKQFVITDENKSSIEQLAIMTKQGGALSDIFENINRLTDLDTKFDLFDKQLNNMDKSMSTTVAIGNDFDKNEINNAIEAFGEISKVVLSLSVLGLLLITVGLLGKYIDFNAVFTFVGILALFLSAVVGVFVLASKYMAPGSDVVKGIKGYSSLIAVSAAILIFGALMNRFIPFADTLMFTLKLGLFLLTITGIFVLWNKYVTEIKDGISDAVAAVGLAAFIMFLGAACYKALNISALLGFTFTLATFLFALAITLWAVRIALGGQNGIEKILREMLYLVTGAAFIMFLGAACYNALSIASLLGFTAMLNLFLRSIIKTLEPLIAETKDIEQGKNVIKSLGEFVALSAAVMLIGGGLILAFPKLIITIPIFTGLLNLFLKSIIKRINRLVAVNGIFAEGNKIIQEVNKFVIISAATMSLGGLLLMKFPELIAYIPIFIGLMDLLLWSVTKIIKELLDKLKIDDAIAAYILLSGINKIIRGVSIAIGIMGVTAIMIEKYGGKVAFAETVGLMYLILKGVIGLIETLSEVDEAQLKKAINALRSISISLLIVSGAFLILAQIQKTIKGAGGFWEFAGLVTLLGITLGGLTWSIFALAKTLGNAGVAVEAYLAIGVVLAAAAAFGIVAVSLLAIANTLKILSTIKSFDMTPIIKGVGSIMILVKAITPLIFVSPIIVSVSLALMTLTKTMSMIAETVKEYADLKISIYEGTKKVGYRHLTQKDFKDAATNISLLVAALSTGIKVAYDKNPGMFSTISWEAFWSGGQSPIQRVIRQSKELAPLISKIADSVKDYADLKIKIYEGDKHVGYRHLNRTDFKTAANNISLVVSTLTKAIMDVYDDHKDWYGATISWSSFVDMATGNSSKGTPLERVIKQNTKLASLISKIGDAIGDIANLKFPTKWNKDGKAISYKLLNNRDFNNASKNVSKVITTLSNAIMDVYKDHSDWYGVGGKDIKTFFTSALSNFINGSSPMERVIAHNIKLAKLISKVSSSIGDYAELTVPIDWDNEGKVINYRNIKNEDFVNAGNNISKVLTTLSVALLSVYEEHSDWYSGTGIFGLGDTPMQKVLSTSTKMSKLISNVASSVKDYANLVIPKEVDPKTGEPTKFDKMGLEDFIEAGASIGSIITTAALGLTGYYADGTETPYRQTIVKYLMKDIDDNEEFAAVLDNSQKIATIISGMADNIGKYAKMLIPSKWDPKTGVAIEYKLLSDKDMEDAGAGIGKIIVCVADSLKTAFTNNKEMFGWNEEKQEFEDDAPIKKVIDSCLNMGSIIGNIVEGIVKYAEMKMPIDWDENGKPIKFQEIKETLFTDAANHIATVLTTVGGTIIGIYKANDEMFNIRTKKEGGFLGIGASDVPAEEMTPFERVVDASVKMVTVIGGIAQALQIFADGKVIGKDANGKDIISSISGGTIALATVSIEFILTAIADEFKKLAGPDYKELFSGDNVNLVVEAVGNMMTVVSTMASSIQSLAMLNVPIKWDANGKPVAFRRMNKNDFNEAKENIKTILTAIGEAFSDIIKDPNIKWVIEAHQNTHIIQNQLGKPFSETTIEKSGTSDGIIAVFEGMTSLATILSIISGNIYGYATRRFPIGTKKDGTVQYSEKLSDTDIENAKTNIKDVALALSGAMYELINGTGNESIKHFMSENGNEDINNLNALFEDITSTIGTIVSSLKEVTSKENVKALENSKTSLQDMVEPLTSILDNINKILNILFEGNEQKYGYEITKDSKGKEEHTAYSFSDIINKYKSKFDETGNNINNFITSLTTIIGSISSMNTPISDSYRNINSLHELFEKEMYVSKIDTIITSMSEMLFSMNKISKFDKIFLGENYRGDDFITNIFNTDAEIRNMTSDDINRSVNNIVQRLTTYSSLIFTVIETLKKINSDVSNLQIANFDDFNNNIYNFFKTIQLIKSSIENSSEEQSQASFDILTKGIININEAIATIDMKSARLFTIETTQLDKFVKSVNSIKLLNLNQMNKFVTSLNQLANKMGNLDRLTEAISNKLSKVLEKLVERLVHAEQTIVKADEIQKRRHELIKKSVEEVSNLMKQPMTIEVQATSNSTTVEESPTDTTKTT